MRFQMEKMSIQPKTYNAKKLIICMLLAACVVTALFSAYFYREHRRITPFDASGYTLSSDDMRYGVDWYEEMQNGYINISGYAYREGTTVGRVDSRFVVQDLETGQYYALCTKPELRSDINDATDDDTDYLCSGLKAVVSKEVLPEKFHIYIAYANEGDPVLLDTGITRPETV